MPGMPIGSSSVLIGFTCNSNSRFTPAAFAAWQRALRNCGQ